MTLFRRRSLGLVLFLGFLTAFVVYLVNNLDEFRLLTEVSPPLLIVVAAGHSLSILMNAYFLVAILRPFGRHLGLRESTYVSLMSSIGNYFTPFRGGAGIRALYLKRRHGLRYASFLSTLAGTYVIAFSVSALAGLVTITVLRTTAPPATLVWIGVFLVTVLTGCIAVAAIGVPWRVRPSGRVRPILSSITEVFEEVNRGWNSIARDRWLVAKLSAITFGNLLLVIAITHAEAAALGIEATFWGVVLYSVITSLAVLVAITPGGLGIRESIAILSASAIGFTTPEILAIAVIDRLTLFVVLGVGWLLSPLIFRQVKSEADEAATKNAEDPGGGPQEPARGARP